MSKKGSKKYFSVASTGSDCLCSVKVAVCSLGSFVCVMGTSTCSDDSVGWIFILPPAVESDRKNTCHECFTALAALNADSLCSEKDTACTVPWQSRTAKFRPFPVPLFWKSDTQNVCACLPLPTSVSSITGSSMRVVSSTSVSSVSSVTSGGACFLPFFPFLPFPPFDFFFDGRPPPPPSPSPSPRPGVTLLSSLAPRPALPLPTFLFRVPFLGGPVPLATPLLCPLTSGCLASPSGTMPSAKPSLPGLPPFALEAPHPMVAAGYGLPQAAGLLPARGGRRWGWGGGGGATRKDWVSQSARVCCCVRGE
eukprot:Rhum_TRINITY_DN14305_c1_g1::Rhum_TRINITY_DN14305_c1_g1_i1::g.80146::m.80146